MNRSKRKWKRSAGLGLALVAAMAIAGCEPAEDVAQSNGPRTTVPGVNTVKNVAFYFGAPGGEGPGMLIATGTIAFDKSGLSLDTFEAQWRLSEPEDMLKMQHGELSYGGLLEGAGVLRMTRTGGGTWSISLHQTADENIYVHIDSVADGRWTGTWLHETDEGWPVNGTFETVPPGPETEWQSYLEEQDK